MSERKKGILAELSRANKSKPLNYKVGGEIFDNGIKRVVLDIDGIPLRGRPPVGQRPKKMVSIRLDQEIVEHFKAAGSGWQTRINAALAASIKAQVETAKIARGKDRGTKLRSVKREG